MKLKRLGFKLTAGVRDFTTTADVDDISTRRNYVYYTIDKASFQKWVVFVAGVGFFTDAYDIFALNVVLPILEIVYFNGAIPLSYETALVCATLVGTLIGQVLFGVLGDIYGRRKMYGLELTVVICATLGVAMSATGEKGSMNIMAWLIFWRIMMGVGIGADYPLSSVICSEFAPTKHRARMLAAVFFCQPLGQLLGMIVSLVVVTLSRSNLLIDGETCTNDDCIRTLDSAWRWIVGFGSIPALVALGFRLTIPESPRYLLDVIGAVNDAAVDTKDYYEGGEFDHNQDLLESGIHFQENLTTEQQTSKSPTQEMPPTSSTITEANDEITIIPSSMPSAEHPLGLNETGSYNHSKTAAMHTVTSTPSMRSEESAPLDEQQPPKASWQDAHQFFITEKNWINLATTSATWFLLDFAFYGLGLSVPAISANIWHDPDSKTAKTVYTLLLDNTTQALVLVSIGTMTGSILIMKAIKYWSSKAIQFYGFIALTILFIAIGGAFDKLLKSDFKGVIIMLYVLCQIAFNLGPNTTTFIIPAEIFPTRYRCTCHGISAAAGKLGSILGQIFILYAFPGGDDEPGEDDEIRKPLGNILMILSSFMAVGAVVSRFLLPETRDKNGKSKTLEVLAEGKARQ